MIAEAAAVEQGGIRHGALVGDAVPVGHGVTQVGETVQAWPFGVAASGPKSERGGYWWSLRPRSAT